MNELYAFRKGKESKMRNSIWVSVLMIIVLSVAGCTNDAGNDSQQPENSHKQKREQIAENWEYHGYIIDEKENQILLVSGVTEADISTMTVEQLLTKASPNAIWLHIGDISKTFSVGDKVYAWTTGMIDESYPAFGTATKIERDRSKD